MISLERFQDIACEIADEIPREFFHTLNGGIILLDQAKLHEDSVPEAPLYVMGEYSSSRMMGQSIQLYYGSFERTFGNLPEEQLREEIRKVIRNAGKSKIVLLSTHIMQEVEAMCSRAVIINHGSIVADSSIEQLKAQGHDSLEHIFQKLTKPDRV